MAFCTDCGHRLRADVRFCEECGAATTPASPDRTVPRQRAPEPAPFAPVPPPAVPSPRRSFPRWLAVLLALAAVGGGAAVGAFLEVDRPDEPAVVVIDGDR